MRKIQTSVLVVSIVTIAAAGTTTALPRAARAQNAAEPASEPADSIYRAARNALSEGENERAAALFGVLVDNYPDSEYAPDALYWRAFSLYRAGGFDNMRAAFAALTRQREIHPNAATRGDARTLAVRISGHLARQGYADAAERIRERARAMADRRRAMAATRAAMAASRSDMADARERMAVARRHMTRARARARGAADRAVDPDCPEAELRAAALNALMRMDEAEAIPVAREVLAERGTCSEELREHALYMLVRTDAPEIQELLLDVAANDPSGDVREAAVYALARMNGAGSAGVLMRLFRESDEDEVREAVLHALARSSDPRVSDFLRQVVADSTLSMELRESAVDVLAGLDDPRAIEALKEIISQNEQSE